MNDVTLGMRHQFRNGWRMSRAFAVGAIVGTVVMHGLAILTAAMYGRIADAGVTAAQVLPLAAGLWSADPAKQVKDEQREAYATQMQFVEAVEVHVGGKTIVLARYDHPKFPSSAERFAAWKAAFAGK